MAESAAVRTLDHVWSAVSIRAEQTQASTASRTSTSGLARHNADMAIVAQDDSTVPVAEGAIAFLAALIRPAMRRTTWARAAVQFFIHSATFAPFLKSSRLVSRSIQILALIKARGAYLPVPRSIDLLS